MKHVNWLGSLLLLGACGGSPTPTDAGGGGNDTGRPNDTGAPVDAPTAGPPLHNCEEADFVDRTTGAD